jgi:hypothetical protein
LEQEKMPDESDNKREPEVDDNDGLLEVDDRQSEEIREIFGTAFPQYLQPVEEIVEQILSGKGDAESLQALEGMLLSLEGASTRMGFDDIYKLLKHLHDQVSGLEVVPGEVVPAEVREVVLGDLLELRDLADQMGGGGAQDSGERQKTIFTALKGKEGIGDLVLKRLSAAGLVTVDQLLMAKPDEIAAVTGLGSDIVENLLKVLAAEEAPAGSPPEIPAEVESLHEQVLERLRAEVEAESSIEDLKAAVSRLHSRVLERRAQLDALDDSLEEMQKAFRQLSDRMAERAAFIDEIRSRRDDLARACAASEESMRREEIRIKALGQERRSLKEQAGDLGRAVGGLLGSLGKVRRLVVKRRVRETE